MHRDAVLRTLLAIDGAYLIRTLQSVSYAGKQIEVLDETIFYDKKKAKASFARWSRAETFRASAGVCMQYDIVHQLRSTAHGKGKEQTTSVGLLSALKNPSALTYVR